MWTICTANMYFRILETPYAFSTRWKSRSTMACADSKQLRRQYQLRWEVNLNSPFLNWHILHLLRHHSAVAVTSHHVTTSPRFPHFLVLVASFFSSIAAFQCSTLYCNSFFPIPIVVFLIRWFDSRCDTYFLHKIVVQHLSSSRVSFLVVSALARNAIINCEAFIRTKKNEKRNGILISRQNKIRHTKKMKNKWQTISCALKRYERRCDRFAEIRINKWSV